MDVTVVSPFFALLALTAGAGTVFLGAAALAARAAGMEGSAARVVTSVGPSALSLAWLVAATATVGSLYYSEVVGLVPCELCWYQRIAMYPLAIVLGIGALRQDQRVRWYGLPLAVVGGLIAAYHYWLQWNPQAGGLCSVETPCSAMLVRQFGFISIPAMALAGFAAITVLLLLARPDAHDDEVAVS